MPLPSLPRSASPTKPGWCRRIARRTRCSPMPTARPRAGSRCIIAGAGGAAHLPGMLAAKTVLPVLGVPIPTPHLRGEDSLLSIVQMPKGVPVATFAIGEAGAVNAALFAVAMLARGDAALREKAHRLSRHADPGRARDDAAAREPRREVIVPGSWLGLLGGGQLGRMFCMAAQSMGYRVAVLDPGDTSPAGIGCRPPYPRRLRRPGWPCDAGCAGRGGDDRIRERSGGEPRVPRAARARLAGG